MHPDGTPGMLLRKMNGISPFLYRIPTAVARAIICCAMCWAPSLRARQIFPRFWIAFCPAILCRAFFCVFFIGTLTVKRAAFL